jgi:hypothetical protein
MTSLRQEIAEVKQTVTDSRPDLGILMSAIEMHYTKLAIAGLNKNWDLAKYQIEEIKNELNQSLSLYSDLHLSIEKLKIEKRISEPEVTEIEEAIKRNSTDRFFSGFKSLTKACNECHQAAGFAEIVVQPPQGPSFTNQNFEKRK